MHMIILLQAAYNQEGVIVKISTDGGATWTALNPETPNPTNTNTSILKEDKHPLLAIHFLLGLNILTI